MKKRLMALVMAPDPVEAILASVDSGEMGALVPEFLDLAQDSAGKGRHKNNLLHTAKVVAQCPLDETVRLAAFFHDIGKPATRKIEGRKVSFHNHEWVGAKMTRKIMRRLGFSDLRIEHVSLIVQLSGRLWQADDWSDAAVRRFCKDAGPVIGQLLDFCYNDTTSRHESTRKRVHDEVDLVRRRIAEVAEKDAQAALRPPVNGREIMERYNLPPGDEVGRLKGMLSHDMSVEEAWKLLDEVMS